MNAAPLQALIKTLLAQAQQAKALNIRLAGLNNATGKQRTNILLELRAFLNDLSTVRAQDLHILQATVTEMVNPAYQDTLGRDSLTDLNHMQVELENLRDDFRRLALIHKAGSQPKEWLESQFRNLNMIFNELSDFMAEMVDKAAHI
jgi:hypothetical protein